eukprot:scaffold113690_cov26-Cyclotella_meneghiniana.AAC.2
MVPPPQPNQNQPAGATATAHHGNNVTPAAAERPQAVNPYDTPCNAHNQAPIINGRNDMYAAFQSFIDGVTRSIEAYQQQVEENDRNRCIKEAFSRQNLTERSEAVSETLASEMPIDAATLEKLIEQKGAAEMKAKDKEIAKLNKRLENANSTKNSRGAQPGGASPNKSTEQSTNRSSKKRRGGRNREPLADVAANDTLAVSSPCG